MKALINSENIKFELLQIANMNYGQMQRWKDFVSLNYTFEVSLDHFIEKLSKVFGEFRLSEIEDDDVDDFPELSAYRDIGRPELPNLAINYPKEFEGVIKFIAYDALHQLVVHPIPVSEYYYSINSLDKVCVIDGNVVLSGICFKSDYVEHTYNYEQPRKHALLKNRG